MFGTCLVFVVWCVLSVVCCLWCVVWCVLCVLCVVCCVSGVSWVVWCVVCVVCVMSGNNRSGFLEGVRHLFGVCCLVCVVRCMLFVVCCVVCVVCCVCCVSGVLWVVCCVVCVVCVVCGNNRSGFLELTADAQHQNVTGNPHLPPAHFWTLCNDWDPHGKPHAPKHRPVASRT